MVSTLVSSSDVIELCKMLSSTKVMEFSVFKEYHITSWE